MNENGSGIPNFLAKCPKLVMAAKAQVTAMLTYKGILL